MAAPSSTPCRPGDGPGAIVDPVSESPGVVCPFCGCVQPAAAHCAGCGVAMDAGTRRATLERMGPWAVRDPQHPFMPGCSWAQLAELVSRGVVTRATVIRGPTTRQLWSLARRVPGVAHLLGVCHACQRTVRPTDPSCPACAAIFGAPMDRNHLGLPEEEESGWSSAHQVAGGAEPAPRLSSFATDDELREGVAENTRLRRVLGGGAPHSNPAPPGGPAPRDQRARRPTLLLPVSIGVLAVAAVAGGAVVLAQVLGRAGVRDSDAQATPPAIVPARSGGAVALAPPEPPPLPALVPAASPQRRTSGQDAPDAPRSPAPPGATPASPPAPPPAPPANPLDQAEARLRMARDPALTADERRAHLQWSEQEAARILAATPPAPADVAARARALTDAVAEERRRIDAEEFLRGRGSAPPTP